MFIIASKSGIKRVSYALGDGFLKSGMDYHFEAIEGYCTKSKVNELIKKLAENKCDIVVGAGGGTVLDTAKAVAYYAGVPVAIFPTVASSDAPCSALSVLYTDDGVFDEYIFLKQSPALVLVDTQMIANAPARLLVAGMGDAMATAFEAASVKCSGSNNQVSGKPTIAAQILAKTCREVLLADGLAAKLAVEQNVCTKALENIVEVNTYLSGVGFESGGLGAAHAVQKGFTLIPETKTLYHGEIVAFGTLMHMVLENDSAEEIFEIMNFFGTVGLPITLGQMGIESIDRGILMQAAEFSSRPGMTIHNMPFSVTASDVFAAFLTADALGKEFTSKCRRPKI